MENLAERLDEIQDVIDELLNTVSGENLIELSAILPVVSDRVAELLILYARAHGKIVENDPDLLQVLKAFVKGDPSLNAIRDNVREIVYYQNCLTENREDALPKNPAKMAVRTLQHIYFYLRSRLEQESLLN